MADYEFGDEAGDETGEESMGDADVLGAIWRRRRRGGRPQRALAHPQTQQGQRIFRQPPLPNASFQPNVARLRSYMGVGFATWVTVDGADKALIVEPQESFRGERLIIDVTASGGTPAGLTLLRRIDIGTLPQSPSVEQPAPAAMFRADATFSRLDLQIAYRATKVQVTLGQTAAPGAGVTAVAAVGFFGEWIR